MEGPDLEALQSLVVEAVPILIRLLTDKSVVVRDTVAWTIGRICELLPQAIFNSDHFKALINSLLESLQAEPRVAANVCWVSCMNVGHVLQVQQHEYKFKYNPFMISV